jgi:hypothetical protein
MAGMAGTAGTAAAAAGDTVDISNLVHGSVRTIISSVSAPNAPDVTMLSALVYMSCNTQGMTTSSVMKAQSYVKSAEVPTDPAPPVCVEVQKLVTDELVAALPTGTTITTAKIPETVAGLMEGFYKGGRNAFARFMRLKIDGDGGWPQRLTDADETVFRTWLDNLKNNLNDIELPNMRRTMPLAEWTTYKSWMQSVAALASVYLRADIDATNEGGLVKTGSSSQNGQIVGYLHSNFNDAMLDSIVNVALHPWLTLYFIDQFATQADFNVHTQVYANKLLFDAAANAINKVKGTYADPTQAPASNLATMATGLGMLMPTTTLNIDSSAIKVLTEAARNRKSSQELATLSANMETRLGRSLDLQVRFQVLEAEVVLRRRVMLLWIIALLAVLTAAVVLITTDRLTAFMLLSLGTLGIVAVAITLPALYLMVKRKTNTL